MKIHVREAVAHPDDKSMGTMLLHSATLENPKNIEDFEAQANAAVEDMGRGWRKPNLNDALYGLARCILNPSEEKQQRGAYCAFIIWDTAQAEFDAALKAIAAKVREALGPEATELWAKLWQTSSTAKDEDEAYSSLVSVHRTTVEFEAAGTLISESELYFDVGGANICHAFSGWKFAFKVYLVSGASGNLQDFLDVIPQLLKAKKVEASIRKLYAEKFRAPVSGTYSVKVCDKDWGGNFDDGTKKSFRVKASSPRELLKTILTKIGFDDDVLDKVEIETMDDVEDYLWGMEEMEGTMIISLKGPGISYSSANYNGGW